MRCFLCPRPITAADAHKRVEWRDVDVTGSHSVVMFGQDHAPLSQARGTLVRAAHGKALPLLERVLTHHGWRQAGQLTVGDTVVAGDGLPTRIRAVHFDGQMHQVRLVRLSDGAECQADMEHLWMTSRGIVQTSDLQAGDILPRSPAYDGWEPAPGHPYALGALLGDGFLPGMFVTTADAGVRDILVTEAAGVPRQRMTHAGRQIWDVILRSQEDAILRLGLAGLTGRDKHVPASVWAWPAVARLELLRGLMDTDGFVSRSAGQVGFTGASEQLVRGVQQLTWSLGGSARRSAPSYVVSRGKKYGPYHTVFIRLPQGPFRLARKREAWLATSQSLPKRKVAEVLLQDPSLVVCYTLEVSTGLFVAGDFMVTHNCYHAWRKRAPIAGAKEEHSVHEDNGHRG